MIRRSISSSRCLPMAFAAGALLLAPAAMAAPATRLVSCTEGDCVMVSGRRDDAASQVRINGHLVSVEGRRAWSVRLPVETVRAWSPPLARTVDVTVRDAAGTGETTEQADLPIGLLGHVTDLAALVVRVR